MKYLLLTLKHKWFVLVAGLRIGVPLWRLLLHDWTKFMPCELPHYQRQFFGAADRPMSFMRAWTHHQNSHGHHWEYWIPRTGHNRCNQPFPDNEPIPMPEWAILEMFADWQGASRTYEKRWPEPGMWPWMQANYHRLRLRLHPDTQRKLDKLVYGVGWIEKELP